MAKEIIGATLLAAVAAGLIAAVAVFPVLRRAYLCLFFIGASRIFDINFVSREEYRGWVRGFELGSQDMLLAGLLGAILLGWGRHKPRLLPPIAVPILVYLGVAVLSALTTLVPLYSAFGLLKLARYATAYWIIANATWDETDLRWVFWSLMAAIGIESFESITDYAHGVYRARGTFDHSNTLGMYLNMLVPLALSCVLNLRTRLRAAYLVLFGLGAGVVVLTLSRGSWMALGIAVAVVTPLSLALRLRPEKLAVLGLIALLSLPPGVIAAQKMLRRVKEAPESSGEARETFNLVARQMAGERLFGVGINNYSEGTNGIYSAPFGDGLDRGGLCHNLYFITVGEMGWGGLAALLGVFAAAALAIIRPLVRSFRENLRSVFLVGWMGGLATVAVQSALEWAMLQTPLAMTFYGLLGISAAIAGMPAGHRPARYRIAFAPAGPAATHE